MSFPIESDVLYDKAGDAAKDGIRAAVLVTSYNYAGYIEDTLATVLKQTHQNLELIVVDDGSTDGSQLRVRNWMEQHSGRFARTALVAHRQNYGVPQARNAGFSMADSDYVFVLDADNGIYPTAVARLLAACVRSGAHAAYSQLELFGGQVGLGNAVPWSPDRFVGGNYVDAMALVRKSAWRAVGGYDLFEPRGLEDYDFWCKFVEHDLRGIFVPQILCRYRIHAQSLTATEAKPKAAAGALEMVRRHPWLALSAD